MKPHIEIHGAPTKKTVLVVEGTVYGPTVWFIWSFGLHHLAVSVNFGPFLGGVYKIRTLLIGFCTYVCVCVYTYVCTYVFMYVCMYVGSIHIYIYVVQGQGPLIVGNSHMKMQLWGATCTRCRNRAGLSNGRTRNSTGRSPDHAHTVLGCCQGT